MRNRFQDPIPENIALPKKILKGFLYGEDMEKVKYIIDCVTPLLSSVNEECLIFYSPVIVVSKFVSFTALYFCILNVYGI